MFEFDRTNLSINRDIGLLPFDGGSIAAVLEPQGDLEAKFGLNGLHPEGITFSVVVFPDRSLLRCRYTLWGNGDEENFSYEPTKREQDLLWELLEEFSLKKYGCTLAEFPEWFRKNALKLYGVNH